MRTAPIRSRRRPAGIGAIRCAARRRQRCRAAPGRALAMAAMSLGAAALTVAGWPMGTPAHAVARGDRWVEPVVAPVVDGYRPPEHVGAPGNRGWEYATVPGTEVVAAGAGVVVFAGSIGGSAYVSIQHPDGRRTTYAHVAVIDVAAGDRVTAGDRVATSGSTLHFGLRIGDQYRDPGELFGPTASSASGTVHTGGTRLLPVAGRPATDGDRIGVASASPTFPPAALPGRNGLRAPGERRPALGRWLASVALPANGSSAQGWTGATTDTLAAGPRHIAADP